MFWLAFFSELTGVFLSPTFADLGVPALMEVLSIPGVVGLKESSRNQRFLAVLLHDSQQRGLAHIFTTLEVLLGTLILGASGGTMPPISNRICQP